MILIGLSSCVNKIPLVTLNQIDTVNEKINPWKVDKYNDQTCKMEGHLLDAEELLINGKVNPKLHAGVWISKEDYAALLKFSKTECLNRKNQNDIK